MRLLTYFALVILAMVVAGVYGAIHDQISFSVSTAILALEALRLSRSAQAIRKHPLPRVIDEVARRSLVRPTDVARVLLAATRAGVRSKRWFGWVDTCLTRSVVAGAMLSRSREVVLCVGFRPGAAANPADGHAWLTVDGAPADGGGSEPEEEPYETVLEIPFSERGGEGS